MKQIVNITIDRIIALIFLAILSSCSPLFRALNLAPSNSLKKIVFLNKSITPQYRFFYSDTTKNEYLRKLRTNYGLNTIASNHEDEFSKIKAILNWTNKQWSHSGSNTPSKFDPISILEEAKDGNNFRCVEYGIVSAGALSSIGIQSRVLALKTSDVAKIKYGAGHVVAESYSKKFEKWIFIDGQYNAIPMLKNIPLNAVEFQKAILENIDELKIVNSKGEVSNKEKEKYIKWISKYLYYFDVNFDNRNLPYEEKFKLAAKSRLMLVPLGAENPSIFQKKSEIDYCLYTNNVNDFYQKPK